MIDLNLLVWKNFEFRGEKAIKADGLGFEYIITKTHLRINTKSLPNSNAILCIPMTTSTESRYYAQIHHHAVRLSNEAYVNKNEETKLVEGRVIDLNDVTENAGSK